MQEALLLETIKIENGVFQNLDYHSARMNRSCMKLGISNSEYDLQVFLKHFSRPALGTWKYRIFYDRHIRKIHLSKYVFRSINSLRIIHADSINYPHKYIERDQLNTLFAQRGVCDDIIIVKEGMVTDSYYANLLFLKKGVWYTPFSYLLRGTQRERLLATGKIKIISIPVEDIHKFEKVKLINAMLDLDQGPEIEIENIIE